MSNHGGLVQIMNSFLSKWVICRFQPLIFQGVVGLNNKLGWLKQKPDHHHPFFQRNNMASYKNQHTIFNRKYIFDSFIFVGFFPLWCFRDPGCFFSERFCGFNVAPELRSGVFERMKRWAEDGKSPAAIGRLLSFKQLSCFITYPMSKDCFFLGRIFCFHIFLFENFSWSGFTTLVSM